MMSSAPLVGNRAVAVVTGAAGGIGRGLVHTFAEAGYAVALVDVNVDELTNLKREFTSNQTTVDVFPVDVTNREAVQSTVARIEADFGRTSVLVNNAAIFNSTALIDVTDEEWHRVQAVNVLGALHCATAVFPYMKERKTGSIVNIVSLAGKRGRSVFSQCGEPAWAVYAVSKATLAALTLSMAWEWAPHGIRVNGVAPGPILSGDEDEEKRKHTSEIPLERFGTAVDVARAALFLAGESSGFIHGEIIDVNGGLVMD